MVDSQNPKIAFFDAKLYDRKYFDLKNELFNYQIKYFEAKLNNDTAQLTNGFNVVCAFVNDIIDKKVIDILVEKGVKLIALRCAGFNNVNIKSIYEKIHVVRVPSYSPYAVAEHAVGLMLCLNRHIHRAYYRVREGDFSIKGFEGFDMRGKTAGIIGTGKIGLCVIEILKGFGMKVLAYDPFPNVALEKEKGFTYVSLKDLYGSSDVISLHCPLTPENEYMINHKSINIMRDGVMIINTGRGKLIDTKALVEGLKERKIGSAGLDVYEEEGEYFFEDFSSSIIIDDVLARLLTFPNVLITSHQGFFTKEALINIANTTLENIQEYFSGGYLKNEICYHCGKECIKKKKKRCF